METKAQYHTDLIMKKLAVCVCKVEESKQYRKDDIIDEAGHLLSELWKTYFKEMPLSAIWFAIKLAFSRGRWVNKYIHATNKLIKRKYCDPDRQRVSISKSMTAYFLENGEITAEMEVAIRIAAD